MVVEPVMPSYEVKYEQLKGKEILTLQETIYYNDDVAIRSNALFEKNCSTAVRNGDIEFLMELQKSMSFSEPGHYEV